MHPRRRRVFSHVLVAILIVASLPFVPHEAELAQADLLMTIAQPGAIENCPTNVMVTDPWNDDATSLEFHNAHGRHCYNGGNRRQRFSGDTVGYIVAQRDFDEIWIDPQAYNAPTFTQLDCYKIYLRESPRVVAPSGFDLAGTRFVSGNTSAEFTTLYRGYQQQGYGRINAEGASGWVLYYFLNDRLLGTPERFRYGQDEDNLPGGDGRHGDGPGHLLAALFQIARTDAGRLPPGVPVGSVTEAPDTKYIGIPFGNNGNGDAAQHCINNFDPSTTPAGDFGSSFPESNGMQSFSAFSADPVNLATGNFVSRADDLVLPGRVLSFAFTRWYNSSDSTTGPLGPAWTHAYNWSLRDQSSTVEVRRGDGSRHTFTRSPDGSYANPPDILDTFVRNGDGTFTLTLTNQVAYAFTATGQLTRLREPAGNQITLAFTGGNLTTITDTVGRQVTLAYDAQNRLSELRDPLGRRVTYAYDASGRLQSVTDKLGNAAGGDPTLHQWRYAYDGASQHLTTITDPDGRVRVRNSYDSQGRVFEQRDGPNALTTMSYGAGQTTLTDPRGHPSTYTFDARMRVLTQTDVVGGQTFAIAYTYDAVGNRTSVTDRRGSRTDFSYDSRGNVLTKTDPQVDPLIPRYLTQFTYDGRNNLTQIVDPVGFSTTLTYDSTTNVLLSVSRQIDATTSAVTKYEYADPANPGLPTRVIAPRGNTTPTPDYAFATSLRYDAQANLIERLDPDAAKTTFAYDAVGRLTSFVDPDGNAAGGIPAEHTWQVAYDELDRETRRTDPLGNVLRYGYDGAGNRTAVTDRRGNVTTYAYDANARLLTTQQKPDPVGNPTLTYTTSLTRDASGNATRITQANGVVTDYAFDALNRLTSVTTHPDAQTNLATSYVLDGNGNPTSRTTGDGVTVSYVYDALSRLTSVSATGLSITYAYDALGRRTQMTDGTGTTTYQYDGLGRLTQVAAPNGTLSYAYDRDGNRTTLGYPASQNVTYTYSPGGRMQTVQDWASRLSSYAYTPSGLVQSLDYPNGMGAGYLYDRAQRLTRVTNTWFPPGQAPEPVLDPRTLTDHAYTLDPEGNRTALDEFVEGITPPVFTWSASLRVNDDAGTTQQDRPQMALGADGASYLIWDDYRAGSHGDIFFSRREPFTGTWSANQKVNGDSTTRTQWNPAIAVDGTNNAYAIWQDDRDGNRNVDTNIYFAKRTAATGTWGTNLKVNDDTKGSPAQTHPKIAVKADGAAAAVWVDFRSSQWNVFSSRLAAGGSSWAANLRVTSHTTSRKFTPDLAVGSDGTAYAVWEDDRSGNSDVWYATLPPGASAWSANEKVSDDPGAAAQYAPHIVLDPSGNPVVSWIDARVAAGEVRMRRFSGGSWQPSRVASDAAAVPVTLAAAAASDGRLFAAWEDARGTSLDLWGSEYNPATDSWQAPSRLDDDPGSTAQMRPTVAMDATEVALAWRDDRVTGGDIRSRRRTAANGTDRFTYAYDGLNRLTTVTGPVAESFSFDAATNIASRTGPSATYTHDASNRLTSDGTQSFVWNGADRLVQRGLHTFSYDALGRLTGSTLFGPLDLYKYDGDGLLVSVTNDGPPTTFPTYLWDVSTAPSRLVSAGSDRVVHGLGPLYLVRADGTTLAFAQDGLGSVRAEVTSSGSTSKAFRYASYGTVSQSAGGSATLLGFAGELADPSGLIYLRARWHDPGVARFITKDPLPGGVGQPKSLNGYIYADCNPILLVDPLGLETQDDRPLHRRGNCPLKLGAGVLGLAAMAVIDAGIAAANVAVLLEPTPIGELAILPVDLAAIYTTLQLIDLVMQSAALPCEEVRVNLVPFSR